MDDSDIQATLNQINERLDYIEDHIVAMSQGGARQIYVPMGRADRRPTDPDVVPPEIADLVRAGKRKEAIVRYRELTGADVQHAQSVVNGLSS
jgi:hypothetical protein